MNTLWASHQLDYAPCGAERGYICPRFALAFHQSRLHCSWRFKSKWDKAWTFATSGWRTGELEWEISHYYPPFSWCSIDKWKRKIHREVFESQETQNYEKQDKGKNQSKKTWQTLQMSQPPDVESVQQNCKSKFEANKARDGQTPYERPSPENVFESECAVLLHGRTKQENQSFEQALFQSD